LLQLAFAWLAAAAFAVSLGFFLYAYLFTYGAAPPTAGPAASAPWSPPWLTNLALFTVFAVHHSLFARTRLKNAVRRIVPPALERAVYTMVASVIFVLVCWWWRPVEGVAWSLDGAWRWAGWGLQGAGIAATFIAARGLDVLYLAGVRQVVERSDRLGSLKTDGLYGIVRHPLYFAWVLFVFGAPHMTMTRLTFAGISTLYLALAIPFEERGLIETFGNDYTFYRQKVRRRMIPWVY
jgi:protein-S-isoprenylcysteine O-methyltransferase Ste14